MIAQAVLPKYTQTEIDPRRKVVQQSTKHFSEKLNHCLDDTDAPASLRERANILSKMLDVPRQQAWGFLDGHQIPDDDLMQKIASEFEVDAKWLSGERK